MWPCGDNTKRRHTASGLQPLEILRRQRVQPAEPVGPGDRDHAAVRQVDHAFAAWSAAAARASGRRSARAHRYLARSGLLPRSCQFSTPVDYISSHLSAIVGRRETLAAERLSLSCQTRRSLPHM